MRRPRGRWTGAIALLGASVVAVVLATVSSDPSRGVEAQSPQLAPPSRPILWIPYELGATTLVAIDNGLASQPVASEQILWNFSGRTSDGLGPYAGLLMDKSGNLYGTTAFGGLFDQTNNGLGSGTLFELKPPSVSGGNWAESILWNFGNGIDGNDPSAGLIMDTHGNLYGTTVQGGAYGLFDGTMFRLASGKERVFWNFGNGADGVKPFSALVRDTSGNLCGTTLTGGANQAGRYSSWPPTVRSRLPGALEVSPMTASFQKAA